MVPSRIQLLHYSPGMMTNPSENNVSRESTLNMCTTICMKIDTMQQYLYFKHLNLYKAEQVDIRILSDIIYVAMPVL